MSARATNQYFVNVRGIPHGDNDIHDRIVAGIVSRDYEATLEALREDVRQII